MEQNVDAEIRRLYELRRQQKLETSNLDFYEILRSGEYLHPQDFLSFLKQLNGKSGPVGPNKTPVVISGILPSPPALLELLDNLDLYVAADDLLNCGRRMIVSSPRAKDPYEALTERYFRLPACPTRSSIPARRADHLLALVRSSRAAGVIFYEVPFCDPELFDLPPLIAELHRHDIRTLVVEAGLNRRLSGQVAVRVEAFAEMIGPGLM